MRPWLEVGWDKNPPEHTAPQYYYFYFDANCHPPPNGPIYVGTPTAGSFHEYRIEYQEGKWNVYIDDVPRIPGGIDIGISLAGRVQAGAEVNHQAVQGQPAWVWHNAMGPSAVLDLKYKTQGGVWTDWDVRTNTLYNIHAGYILHPSFDPYNNFDNYGYNWEGTSLLKQRVTANGQAVAHSGMESVAVPFSLGLGLYSFRTEYNTVATAVLSGSALSPYDLQNTPTPSGGAITVDGKAPSEPTPAPQPPPPVHMAEVSLTHNGVSPTCQSGVWTVEYTQQMGSHVHATQFNDDPFQWEGIQVNPPQQPPSPAYEPRYLRRGDAKADGIASLADLLFIRQYVAGTRQIGEGSTKVYAVNAASPEHDPVWPDQITDDGTPDSDAQYVADYLVGLRDPCYNLIP